MDEILNIGLSTAENSNSRTEAVDVQMFSPSDKTSVQR